MVLPDLDYVFITLDIECKGYIEWIELHEFDETIYYDALDIEQLEAAIETVCGPNSNGRCYRDYFPDIANELERRHVMVEQIKWDFHALDAENVGRISLENTLFLFKSTHDERFSNNYWEKFIASRQDPVSDVCLDEIKLYLSNLPEDDVANSDEEYINCEKDLRSRLDNKRYNDYKQLQNLQETEEYLAALEKERVDHANKIKNNANNLLNRIDEVGLQALLEDDFGDGQTYEGKPKDKVTASELLDALRDKYIVLRDHILLQMLRNHTGEGMWQVLSEREQGEKLFQLKIKEEKLRKEGKLETEAINLPGSRVPVEYNVFSLMGESISELEKRISDQQEKVRESGLPIEEVVREFRKKLNDMEQLKSSFKLLLLDLNNRYSYEKETLTKKLQGLSGYRTLTASDREKIMFSIVQAILRGMQEKPFLSCALCVGLSERVKPRNHDRSAKDPEKNQKLSNFRVQSFKDRRSLDGPILPPRLYKIKSKLGRVDIMLQLLQECEHRFSLEREFLLSLMHSKAVMQNRISVRKLSSSECEQQLSVLCAQWSGWRIKPTAEKLSSQSQTKHCFEEAVALKFESTKEEMKDGSNLVVSDLDVSVSLLTNLQIKQDSRFQSILNLEAMNKEELVELWTEQKKAVEEAWNDNVAVIIFGIVEVSKEETELVDALQNKYDALKDKLLMQALMDQYGKTEWDRLSEKERQRHLAQLKLQEKKLRREGKYDELAKLLGDSVLNSDLLNKQLGENRENYLNKLNERLRNRQRRIEAGEDPDSLEEEDFLEEPSERSTGNILKDLDQRFEDEKDALLRKLREGEDRDSKERNRQAELTRLRLEARKAGREANFDSAALVLGLAERNNAAAEDRLKSDRERQEKLAKERLEARRQKRNIQPEEEDYLDKVEPERDDIVGWRDVALKELARKQEKEYNVFSDLLQDPESEDLRQESREQTSDERQELLNELREKRKALDFGILTDQETHASILEMATATKFVIWDENLKSTLGDDLDPDKVIISVLANLQELQDEETRRTIDLLANLSQEEIAKFRDEQLQAQNEGHLNNISELVFKYEGASANDSEIVKALDKKYDTLLDKLALDALEKQMSDAEWKALSEKERQAKAMQLKLQQKKLMREGKFDEAAKLLGEGLKHQANMEKLMGESRKKYEDRLKEKLLERQRRIADGEEVPDLDDDLTLPEDQDLEADMMEKQSAKSLLENLQQRYEDEKEELLARLQGADKNFMNEKARQAELIRLKREQRKAQKEGKFDTAAMMLGLAERNKVEADARLSNDRARHEMIAKERLEKMRSKRASKGDSKDGREALENEEDSVVDDKDPYNALMKSIEKRQMLEQEELVKYLQTVDRYLRDNAMLMTADDRNTHLSSLKAASKKSDNFKNVASEMAAFKLVNRIEALQSADKDKVSDDDDAIISIMADLQEKHSAEDEDMIKMMNSTPPEDFPALQQQELEYVESKRFPVLIDVLGAHDASKLADEDALVNALDTKYDALKDKLILDALKKQAGDAEWAKMNEKDRQRELVKIKLEQKRLKQEGKADEASKILQNLIQNDSNVKSLLGLSKAEQEKRLKERLAKRQLLKKTGMTDEQIAIKEAKEDETLAQELAKTSTGNALLDLENNYEAEKDILLDMVKDENSVVNQLDTKYDKLKDDLILEALKKQAGDAEWAKMNEKDRQRELVKIKLEQKRLKQGGKADEASKILQNLIQNNCKTQSLLGLTKADQEKRLKERLAKRELLKKTGVTNEEIAIVEAKEDEELVVELAKTSTGNPLFDMEKNYDAEKDALLNSLKDADSRLVSEKQRQLELLRLKREAKKIKAEEKFDTAAMVLGMAKSQQAAVEMKMNSDRSRQEKLAKERLEARRNKKKSVQAPVEELIETAETNDPITLHTNIMNVIENIHETERNQLMELTKGDSHKGISLPSEQKQKRLFVLKELRKNWRESVGKSEEQTDIFREAMQLKIDEMKDSNMKDEDIFVKLLADLQDLQDVEAELTVKDLTDKDINTLKQLFQVKQSALAQQYYDNIASVLFDGKKSGLDEESKVEEEVSDALKEKYDALKEKVYEEVLKGKFDKATLDAMTQKEKEEHIANMKANNELDMQEGSKDLDAVMLPGVDDLVDSKGGKTKKATDILKDLDNQFEAEKNALLSTLKDADSREMKERERQLTLALLRRDKKRIEREEKFDGAALVLNAAKQNEAEKEKSYQNERSRQEQLAKERIAARRKKKMEQIEDQKNETKDEMEKLKEEEEAYKKEDLIMVEKMEKEGTIALHESVVNEMEEKHYAEQDKLYELIQLTSSDKLVEMNKLEADEQNAKLSLLSISRKKLREECKTFVDSVSCDDINEDEKRNYETSLTNFRSSQSQAIHDGLVIALVIKGTNMGKPITDGMLDEEVIVSLMADLQQLQSSENNVLMDALNKSDKEMAQAMKKELRKSRGAGYLDNLATIVFREVSRKKNKEAEKADKEEMKEEERKIEEDAAAQIDELEMELEKKRTELPTMSGDEMERYMKQLKGQEEARRQAINEQMSRQREIAQQRLLDKRRKRDEKIQEGEFVNAMVLDAHKTGELLREKTMAMQGAQKENLTERLQRRREEKKRKAEVEEAENVRLAQEAEKERLAAEKAAEPLQVPQSDTEETPGASPETKQDVATPAQKEESEVKKKKPMPPLPGGGMKREKTVVEKAADISENKKQEMISMLMREQTSLAIKISSEQSRQEEQVRALREKRRKRMEARETEARAVLGLGQRQKTIVEDKQKGERERQIGQIRDRVNRIKQERNSAGLLGRGGSGGAGVDTIQETTETQINETTEGGDEKGNEGS